MDRQQLVEVWRERIRAAKTCGTTIKSWCERSGFSLNQYYHWSQKLRSQDLSRSDEATSPTGRGPGRRCRASRVAQAPIRAGGCPPADWLPLARSGEPDSRIACLTVRIAGAEIDVRPGFDASLLRSAVLALGGKPC